MAKLRSPNYPSMGLPEAISKTKLIYEKEFTNQASREVMIKAMGYGSINGASAVAFSALTKYGLISSIGGDQYKVSEDALNILLLPRGDRTRAESVEKLAFAPQLFAELREQYPSALPSDENLTANLVKRGFNPRSVADLIRNYRETIEYLRTENGNIVDSVTRETGNPEPAVIESQSSQIDEDTASLLTFKISRDSNVQIRFSGPVTQEAIEKLISLLDLSKDVYPTVSELTSKEKVLNIQNI